MFAKFFIDRPVFATVLSLMVFVMGLAVIPQIPVEQFPNVVPPTVVVMGSYYGADAATVARTIAIPVETEVNGVDNMIYMQSTCSNDGAYTLLVYFKPGSNPDMNAVNVMNRINRIRPRLPAEVNQVGFMVQKTSTAILGFYSFQLTEKAAAIRDHTFLSNYIAINVRDKMSRINGVGDALFVDSRDYAMRIWLDPRLMEMRSVSLNEVARVLQEQNVQIAAGSVGSEPAPDGQRFTTILTTKGRLKTIEEFEEMIVRTDKDGRMLRLKEIARIELSRQSYAVDSFNVVYSNTPEEIEKLKKQGREREIVRNLVMKPAATIEVFTVPGANAIEVSRDIDALLRKLKPELDEAGIQYIKAYDTSAFVVDSLKEVVFSMILTILIVIGVVYLFLQNWRAAIIPLVTIPVSLVGSLLIIHLFGFSINMLSLFGLILVVGIVVDDAIVVVENCQRILDAGEHDSRAAAIRSMREVTGPIVATTCVLMAVFVPPFFIAGIVGILYQQFALTLAAAVLISTVCALTLSPALCAILLVPSDTSKRKPLPFRIFNAFFDSFARINNALLGFFARRSILIVLFWIALLVGLVLGIQHVPLGFFPNEDQGYLFMEMRLPDGRTLEESRQLAKRISETLSEDYAEEVAMAQFITGFSLLDGANSSNVSLALIGLRDIKDRPGEEQEAYTLATAMMERLNEKFSDANILVIPPPPFMGIGTTGGLEGQLVSGGDDFGELLYAVKKLDEEGKKTRKFDMIYSPFAPTFPGYHLEIDREKAKLMGVDLDELGATLKGFLGSTYVNDFNVSNRIFKVIIMAEKEFRKTPEDILSLPLMNADGERLTLGAIASLRELQTPKFVTRFNLNVSTLVAGFLSRNTTSGEAMSLMKQIAKKNLPAGYDIEWTGLAYQQEHASSPMLLIFGLSLLFGFLVLAALYESWTAPLLIMMAVPLGVSGSVLAVYLAGQDINLYTQIGLVLMVGLSAKNAILIVEFAREKWLKEKYTLQEAAQAAGRQRLRPIMMTSFAFILGVTPLLFATGAGSQSRIAIGTTVFGGMLEETLVGVIVSPVLFIAVTSLVSRFFRLKKAENNNPNALRG